MGVQVPSLVIMPTINQKARKCRGIKIKAKKSPRLCGCPQKKGVCSRVVTLSPRKPNSARRHVSKIRLPNKRRLMAYIPGQTHKLQEYSQVLIRGGRAPDLPGVNYHLIRSKFDFPGMDERKTSRSKYGKKKPKN